MKLIIILFISIAVQSYASVENSESVSEVDELPEGNQYDRVLPEVYLPNSSDVKSVHNVTENTTQEALNETKKYACCKLATQNSTDNINEPAVEIVNSTTLMKLLVSNPEITSRDTEAECLLVLFFSKSCPFSCQAAPHFNALARCFPNIKMVALDSIKYHTSNAHFGIVGVPTIKLFHNGRPAFKFNGTAYNIQAFSEFVTSVTGQQPVELVVRGKDFQGPVPYVLEQDMDIYLIISWVFIIICSLYYFTKSSWWKYIVETVQNNWRESEAQHQHVD